MELSTYTLTIEDVNRRPTMTRNHSDDITAAWQRVRDLRLAGADATEAAREYLRLYGRVGEAATIAALGGIESFIARETCEELVR